MGNIFKGSEVVELGIQIENNGRDFYSELEKKAESRKTADIFKYLAKEEEKHIRVFQDILDKTERYEPSGLDAADYFSYINDLAAENVFTKKDKGKQAAQAAKNDLEALNMGIGFEKDSIIFYEGMKKVVESQDTKIVEEIIIQEKNHLKILSDIKDTFN
jgi:rubrerythrin